MARRKPRKRKESRNSKAGIYALIIVFLMTFSVIGYDFMSDSESYEFGDYEFKQAGNDWVTEFQDNNVKFQYLPPEVYDIELTPDVSAAIMNSQALFLTSPFNDAMRDYIAIGAYGFQTFLWDNFKIYAELAFSEDPPAGFYPITCENATVNMPVILFTEGNKTEIKMDGNCMLITGDSGSDFPKITERFMYEKMGLIMEPVEEITEE